MKDLAWMRPRLAELCGLKYGHGWLENLPPDAAILGWWEGKRLLYPTNGWHPDKDIAQAIRCAIAVNLSFTLDRSPEGMVAASFVSLKNGEVMQFSRYAVKDDIASAIVLAIAAALGWEET